MNRYIIGSAVTGICALTISVAAQQPPAQTPQSKAPSTQAATATVTVEGCLMNEKDVPGRKPDLVERAGVAEDYILTNAKMIKGSAPQASATKPGQPVGTAGSQMPMYDVKGIDNDRLKPLAGRRVQIEGTFADLTKDPSAGPTEDLADIQGTTIRQVAGERKSK